MPSLRERRLDIPLRVEYFTHRFAKRAGKSVRGISKDAFIEAALTESKGRVSGPFGAAAGLGVPSSTLESKIKALKIDKRRFNAQS